MHWTMSNFNRAWSTFLAFLFISESLVTAYPHFPKQLEDTEENSIGRRSNSNDNNDTGHMSENILFSLLTKVNNVESAPLKAKEKALLEEFLRLNNDDVVEEDISRKSVKCDRSNFEMVQNPLKAQLCRGVDKRREFLLMPLVSNKNSRQSDEQAHIKSKRGYYYYNNLIKDLPRPPTRTRQSQTKREDLPLEPSQDEGSWTCKSVPYTICFSLDHKGQVLDVRRFKPFRMNKIYRRR